MKEYKYQIVEQHLEEMKYEHSPPELDLGDFIIEYETLLEKANAYDKIMYSLEETIEMYKVKLEKADWAKNRNEYKVAIAVMKELESHFKTYVRSE